MLTSNSAAIQMVAHKVTCMRHTSCKIRPKTRNDAVRLIKVIQVRCDVTWRLANRELANLVAGDLEVPLCLIQDL